jgi:tRNA(Ile)-lysidine synthase
MLIDSLKAAVVKYNMLCKGDNIYVGLSGGADSVALLLALVELADEFGVTIRALHVNHRLRGGESERDERFCRDLCENMDVPCDFLDVDVANRAKETKLGIEETARDVRYSWFDAISNGRETHKICTAHTLNDSAETVIFNLCRGAGPKGLAGIPPVRGNIIRPLIMCTRGDVEEYLAGKGQSYVTDSTNFYVDHSRNKIRHLVFPVLEEINGGFLKNIAKSIEIIAAENDFLDAEAKRREGADLRELDGVLRRRVILNVLKGNGFDISSNTVETAERMIMSDTASKVCVGKCRYMKAEGGRLEVEYDEGIKRVVFEPVLAKKGNNSFVGDKTVTISVCFREKTVRETNIHENLTNNFMDCDKIQGDVFLRNRRDGDKYIRAGRNFRSSLKKLFCGGVPRDERDKVAVLCDHEGIIWVEGFGAADRVKVGAETVRMMKIDIGFNPIASEGLLYGRV